MLVQLPDENLDGGKVSGAECGVLLDVVFQVQTHEPAVQQVVVDGLDDMAFAANGEQDLQQGLKQHLRRHRGAASAGVGRDFSTSC